ncbi:MAG: hypothetical protein JXB03_02055 [Spirochaetales bacterium]|nr:hypothetical protein [Spirochaetales bacterium]
MITRRSLSNDELSLTIKEGDFPSEIRASGQKVAVILTQSWCPQWLFMRSWLSRITKDTGAPDIHIYEAAYDKLAVFDEFRRFKESVFNNWEVPYVRYYIDGVLSGESNFVSEQGFLDFFT